MSDLVDEIREDIKEERYAELWKRYGNHLITAAILVILSTAGVVWYKNYKTSSNEKVASKFYAITYGAANQSQSDALEALDEIQYNDKGTFTSLAALKRASILRTQNRTSEAAQVYLELSNDSSTASELRSLSNLLYVSYRINGDLKEIDSEDINSRLGTLTSDKSPWKFHALEQQALLALRLGDREKATAIFEKIANDFSAPASLRERAENLAQSTAS